MTHEEKRAWIRLVINVAAYAAYAGIIVNRAHGRPLPGVPYAGTLLWAIGAAIVASIVAEIVVGMFTPGASRAKDVRDKEIGRFGDYTGQFFVIAGAAAALLMAMAGWNRFWIANVIYLCFVLSAVLGSATKVVAYHGSLPRW
jgi:hypothetical protein